MPVEQNLPKYYTSFSKELDVMKNRVRNIIGSAHWATDGSHKEVILQDVLSRFIPESYAIASGFIISEDGLRCSKQLDIIVYEKVSPTLLRSNNFVIVPSHYVAAVIEVKTSLSSSGTLKTALENLYSVQSLIQGQEHRIHYGIFSYGHQHLNVDTCDDVAQSLYQTMHDYYTRKHQESWESRINSEEEFLRNRTLTSLCINRKMYGLHWNHELEIEPLFGMYYTEDQSFNYFVSNILNSLDKQLVNRTRPLWYPSEKESRQVLRRKLIHLTSNFPIL